MEKYELSTLYDITIYRVKQSIVTVNINYQIAFDNILKTKSNFTLLIYIPFLVIGEWYIRCV